MKKLTPFLILVLIPFLAQSQHTFSIVAVDSVTGEIGSAGATCGDSIIWPGTPGALIVSNIIPGVGGINTQAQYIEVNASNAHSRMKLGDSPQEIINWLKLNDVNSNPEVRQYGIVDYNGGSPRSDAFTGVNCFNYKNHIIGPNYAIQGNILLGQQILDSMEARFNRTSGCLSDKLMAALQGANVKGADSRCSAEGTSSLSAYLRVAKPTNHPDTLFLDLNIAGTAKGVEPINELQTKYNNWKISNNHSCSPVTNISVFDKEDEKIIVYPNPSQGVVNIKINSLDVSRIVVLDVFGRKVGDMNILEPRGEVKLTALSSGTYFIKIISKTQVVNTIKASVY